MLEHVPLKQSSDDLPIQAQDLYLPSWRTYDLLAWASNRSESSFSTTSSVRQRPPKFRTYSLRTLSQYRQSVRSVSSSASTPTNWNFSIDLASIPHERDYYDVSDSAMCIFIDERAEKSKHITTVSGIDAHFEKELRTDMLVKFDRLRIELLFTANNTPLARYGLKWVTDSNTKMAV